MSEHENPTPPAIDSIDPSAAQMPPPSSQGVSAAPALARAADMDPDLIVDADTRFVLDNTVEHVNRDPRTTRSGYNPGMRGVYLPGRFTGLKDPTIPVGKFFAIRSFKTPEEFFTVDENKPREQIGIVHAESAELLIRESLDALGYQSVLFGVEDRAVVGVINKTLLPTLQEIRELCGEASPIPAVCPGEDELDFGQPRTHCATCHRLWIKSDICTAYIQEIAEDGMRVAVRNTDGHVEMVDITPTLSQLTETRAAVLTGLETFLTMAAKTWGTCVTELENKLRIEISLGEHYLRKDIHKAKPADAGLDLVRAMGESIAGRPSQIAPAAAQDTTTPMLLDFIAKQDAKMELMQENNQQFMTALVDRLTGNPAKTEEPAAETGTKTKTGTGGKNA